MKIIYLILCLLFLFSCERDPIDQTGKCTLRALGEKMTCWIIVERFVNQKIFTTKDQFDIAARSCSDYEDEYFTQCVIIKLKENE